MDADPPRSNSTWRWGTALFLVALALRVAYLLQISGSPLAATPLGDGRGYDLWAQGIAGLGPAPEGAFFQAPLYPYFLAAIYSLAGHELWAVRGVQAVLGSLACVALARAGARWVSPRAGWLAGFLLAIYPLAVYYDGLIQKTSLAVSLLCFTLYGFARGLSTRRPAALLGCGLALGLLSLVRENAAILGPVIGLSLLVGGRRSRRGRVTDVSWVVLGGVLALSPVALHNARQGGGGLLPTTFQFGVNLWIGNQPGADGAYHPLELGHVDYGQEQAAAIRQAEEAVGRALTPAEISRYWTQRTLEGVRADPERWLRLVGRKWLMTWNAVERMDVESHLPYADASHVLAGLLLVLPFGVLFALAAWGAVASWDQRRRLWPLYLSVLALTFGVALFFVFGRYRMLLVPPLVLLAAAGLEALRQPQPRARAGLLLASLALGGALTYLPLELRSRDPRAITWANLGVALAKQGQLEQAEPYLRRALDREPRLPQGLASLGELLFRLERFEEAAEIDERARRVVPAGSQAWTRVRLRLGASLLTLEQPGRALFPLEEALAVSPDDVAAHVLTGQALLGAGRRREAAEAARAALKLDPGYAAATELLRRAGP